MLLGQSTPAFPGPYLLLASVSITSTCSLWEYWVISIMTFETGWSMQHGQKFIVCYCRKSVVTLILKNNLISTIMLSMGCWFCRPFTPWSRVNVMTMNTRASMAECSIVCRLLIEHRKECIVQMMQRQGAANALHLIILVVVGADTVYSRAGVDLVGRIVVACWCGHVDSLHMEISQDSFWASNCQNQTITSM